MAIRKSNGYHRKKRNSETRQRKRILLIAAEGNNKTETNYFKAWNGEKFKVDFVSDNYTDPINMVKSLKNAYQINQLSDDDGDIAICLIDHDCYQSKDKTIACADKIAKTSNIKLLVSNPCFEVWFLCHYIYSTKQFCSSDDVIKELKKYCHEYSKSDDEYVKELLPNTPKALENSLKQIEYCLSSGMIKHSYACQPYSEAYEIVKILYDESQKNKTDITD